MRPDQKPLPARLLLLKRGDVRIRNNTHVGKPGKVNRRHFLGAQQLVQHVAGLVEVLGIGDVADVRAKHPRRVDGRQREARLLSGEPVPHGALRQAFRCAVGRHGVGSGGLVVGHGVPVGFGVGVAGAIALVEVDDGGEGGGVDDTADVGTVAFGGLEDGPGTTDGRVEQVATVVVRLEDEGRRDIDDAGDGGGGIGKARLVELGLGDVRDDAEGELGAVGGEVGADLGRRPLGPHGAADVVPLFQGYPNDMASHVAVCARD